MKSTKRKPLICLAATSGVLTQPMESKGKIMANVNSAAVKKQEKQIDFDFAWILMRELHKLVSLNDAISQQIGVYSNSEDCSDSGMSMLSSTLNLVSILDDSMKSLMRVIDEESVRQN